MKGRHHPTVSAGTAGPRSSGSRQVFRLIQGVSATALVIALVGVPLGLAPRAGEIAVTAADAPSLGGPAPSVSPGIIPDDVTALLPLLMTSPERKQFAADLEASIRLGKIDQAERQLQVAIETGTLAIVLADRLHEPSLLSALQTLNIKPEERNAAPADAAESASRDGSAASCSIAEPRPGPGIAELQQALEQEKAQSNAALRELSGRTDELTKVQQAREAEKASTAARIGELQAALQQEREQGGSVRQDLERELTGVRQEYDALRAQQERDAVNQASALSDAKNALTQERGRSEAAARDLAAAREELRSLQDTRTADTGSLTARAAELQAALQQERERASTIQHDLERELASVRQDHSALQAAHEREAGSQASALSEAKNAVAQERERSEAAARDLAFAQEQLRALQESRNADLGAMTAKVADLQQTLRQERDRGDAAARELASLRQEAAERQARVERKAAQDLAGLSEALAQERQRADAVTRELANVLDEMRAVQAVHGSGPAPLAFRLAADGVPSPVEMLPTDNPLPTAQPVIVAAIGPIASGPDQTAALPPAATPPEPATGPTGAGQARNAAPAIAAGRPEMVAPAVSDDRLVRRADALFRSGDVSGARLLLERSMEAGNARAAFLLAETFDPHVLASLGALGIRPDPAKARDLYARALALGVQQAGERMQALR
jgi:hypothetical protein